MLPSLHALSLRAVASSTGTGTPRLMPNATPDVLSDLPPELIEMLMKIIDSPNPCQEVVKLCGLSREWLGRCRSGWMYDAANRALGYYGAQKTWKGVQQHYEAISGAVPPKTPKEYFQAACLARFDDSATNVARYHPFYEARLLQQIRTTGHPLLESISVDFSDYDAANRALGYYGVQKTWGAVLAVYKAIPGAVPPETPKEYFEAARRTHFDYRSRPWTRYHPFFEARLLYQMQNAAYDWKTPRNNQGAYNDHSEILQYVPTDLANYGEIVKLVLQRWAHALRYVPTDLANYGELAKLAIASGDAFRGRDPSTLQYVPTDRADYFEIAKLAVQQNGGALEHVPTDLANYGELAKIAVQDAWWALKFVPTDLANYGELAKIAVQNDSRALEHVPTDRADYFELAKIAVQKDGGLLEHVPTDRADYGELAKIAVQDASRALRYVPTDLANYGELAKIAVQRWAHLLEHVPTDRADYFEIAKLAVQKNGGALEFVPGSIIWEATSQMFGHAPRRQPMPPIQGYGELAKLAVQNSPFGVYRTLRFVPKDRDDYNEILKVAVQYDAKGAVDFDSWALEYVSTDRADYGELAQIAVQRDGTVLGYVPTDRADYGVIAKLAVEEDGRALWYVPKDRADYAELAELAAAALDVPVGELDAVLAATFDS